MEPLTEEQEELEKFLQWVDVMVVKKRDYDDLSLAEIAEIAAEKFDDELTEDHMVVALREIAKRKNFYIAPFAAGDSPPPAEPA